MLIRFRARNFRSLKEEQELSLVAGSLKDSPEAVTQIEGLDLGLGARGGDLRRQRLRKE